MPRTKQAGEERKESGTWCLGGWACPPDQCSVLHRHVAALDADHCRPPCTSALGHPLELLAQLVLVLALAARPLLLRHRELAAGCLDIIERSSLQGKDGMAEQEVPVRNPQANNQPDTNSRSMTKRASSPAGWQHGSGSRVPQTLAAAAAFPRHPRSADQRGA